MVPCVVTKIGQKIDKFTGKLIEDNPNIVKGGEAAIVTIKPSQPVCVEVYN
jgi:elongation factor 1-alpha